MPAVLKRGLVTSQDEAGLVQGQDRESKFPLSHDWVWKGEGLGAT